MAKTKVAQINDSLYDFKNKDEYAFKIEKGLNEDIVKEISKQKNEPSWMLEIRLKALQIYNKLSLPVWGPDLSELDMNNIATYVKPNTDIKSNWEDVPQNIKQTFEKLGIPQAEHKYLAGVGAQYDSEIVYHSIKEDLQKLGVIYTDIDSAIKQYPNLVKQYFSKCVPLSDHKFVALHYAVFSGMVSLREISSSISPSQLTLHLAFVAVGKTLTRLRYVAIPPLFEILRAFTTLEVFLPI